MKLTKKELNESRDMTIGRIRGVAKNTNNDRLLELINKLNKEIDELIDDNNKLRKQCIDLRYKLIYPDIKEYS